MKETEDIELGGPVAREEITLHQAHSDCRRKLMAIKRMAAVMDRTDDHSLFLPETILAIINSYPEERFYVCRHCGHVQSAHKDHDPPRWCYGGCKEEL